MSRQRRTPFPIGVTCTVILLWIGQCFALTYNDTKSIFDDKLNTNVYHTEVPPLNNQTESVTVSVQFELVSIVKVDDVGQKFLCNGFLALMWDDERLVWDPIDYGGQTYIMPQVKHIWKPRLALLNTLEERDLFEDNHATLVVQANGRVFWAPGSLFPASCDLTMANYPFDEQTCDIKFVPINGRGGFFNYIVTVNDPVGDTFYTPNGEWDLVNANISISDVTVSYENLPVVRVYFTIKRRPTIVMLSVMLPVVFLSFLNILVFGIPVESGEKISYGITVLLALSVFLSIVSSMLPKSSTVVPGVTIYLFALLVVSVLTVIVTIIIVFLHNLETEEDENILLKHKHKSKQEKKITGSRVEPLNQVYRPYDYPRGKIASMMFHSNQRLPMPDYDYLDNSTPRRHNGSSVTLNSSEIDEPDGNRKGNQNKYRVIGQYIDVVSFVVFLIVWIALTIGFLTAIST